MRSCSKMTRLMCVITNAGAVPPGGSGGWSERTASGTCIYEARVRQGHDNVCIMAPAVLPAATHVPDVAAQRGHALREAVRWHDPGR